MTIRILKSGERVIVDPAITIQRIYMVCPSPNSQSCHMLKNQDLLSVHQPGLSVPYCYHRNGTIDGILDGVSSLSMLFCPWNYHFDRREEIVRSPSSEGFDNYQCFQSNVDWLEKWGKHG